MDTRHACGEDWAMTRHLALGLTLSIIALSGCSTNNNDCTPGTQAACSCENGATGTQTCSATRIFSNCTCESSNTDAGEMDAMTNDDAGSMDSGMTDMGSDATRPRPDGSVIFVDMSHVDSGSLCVRVADCDDHNACTTDACMLGSCQHAALTCSDSDPCTIDACDPISGCGHSPNCVDSISCTVDSCEPAGSLAVCHHDASNALCNDGNSATTDLCSVSDDGSTGGCLHVGG